VTTRDLWQSIMHYGEFDRMPVIHWAGWSETIQRWEQEGMPSGVNQHEYFDAVPHCTGIGVDLGLLPAFEGVQGASAAGPGPHPRRSRRAGARGRCLVLGRTHDMGASACPYCWALATMSRMGRSKGQRGSQTPQFSHRSGWTSMRPISEARIHCFSP